MSLPLTTTTISAVAKSNRPVKNTTSSSANSSSGSRASEQLLPTEILHALLESVHVSHWGKVGLLQATNRAFWSYTRISRNSARLAERKKHNIHEQLIQQTRDVFNAIMATGRENLPARFAGLAFANIPNAEPLIIRTWFGAYPGVQAKRLTLLDLRWALTSGCGAVQQLNYLDPHSFEIYRIGKLLDPTPDPNQPAAPPPQPPLPLLLKDDHRLGHGDVMALYLLPRKGPPVVGGAQPAAPPAGGGGGGGRGGGGRGRGRGRGRGGAHGHQAGGHSKPMDGHRYYSCEHCDAYLSDDKNLLSEEFRGATGDAYLFRKVVNIGLTNVESRHVLTSNLVRDVYCIKCFSKLGWIYEFAHYPEQSYKKRGVILERKLLRETEETDQRFNELQRE